MIQAYITLVNRYMFNYTGIAESLLNQNAFVCRGGKYFSNCTSLLYLSIILVYYWH